MAINDPFKPQNSNAGTGIVDPFKAKAPTLQRQPVAPPPPAEKSGLLRRVVGDSAVDIARGVVGLGEATVGLANIPTLGGAGKGLEMLGYDPATSKQMIGEL